MLSHCLVFVAREKVQRSVVTSVRLCGKGGATSTLMISCVDIRFRPP